MTYYLIYVFCVSSCALLVRFFVAVCMCMCVKGDGDDSVSVSNYVAQHRTDLMQQPAHERKRWLHFELKIWC